MMTCLLQKNVFCLNVQLFLVLKIKRYSGGDSYKTSETYYVISRELGESSAIPLSSLSVTDFFFLSV